jgi:hypothetical protein
VQFQICNSGEVWTSISAAEAHRIVRKRTGALAKIIRKARKGEQQEAREYRRAERELQQELREADRRSRALWKPIRVRPDDRPRTAIERKPQTHRPTRTGWLAAASQLPRYSGQIIDRAGRAGIFFRVRYYGRATKAGVGRRATLYIWQGAHEMDDGRILFMSNVGETVDEAVAALEAVELFNREAQDGAKVLFHAIANVPYQLLEMDGGIERMFEIGQRFAGEQFGDRDLPFALALHPPSDEGDQRNWHLHLLFSTRPLMRTGDHEWDIGRMMRREIDNPDAFEVMRHLYARVQTEVVREAGLNITYTALSNAERGLPIAPQQHLGAARTARVRRGERDAVNERNWEKSLAGEAALLDERLRHAQETAAAEKALLDRVEERAAPMLVARTLAPHLSIAAPLLRTSPIRDVPQAVATVGNEALSVRMALPVADLQRVARTIAAVPAMTAASTILAMPGVTAVRVRQHRLGTVPKVRDRDSIGVAPPLSASAVMAKPSLPTISAFIRLAGLRANAAVAGEVGLSIGVERYSANRMIDVPNQAFAPESDAADRDLQQIFQLLERREAEAAARRDRLHRERLARQRVEAERLRQQQDDEREREDERRRQEAEDARRVQAEYEAAAALDAMLDAMEAERILIAFDKEDRCVVGDAVLARFGVAPAAISSRAVQTRLDEIANQQRGEIARLGVHLSAHAGDVIHKSGGWTLSANAPADLRRVADAWRHEPALQKAFSDTAAAFRASQKRMPQATAPVPVGPVPVRRGVGPARPGSRLAATSTSRRQILAVVAAQRDALTRQWEQDGGLNETQPATGPAREQQQPSRAPTRRPFPADRGQGR